jgi:signal transduction histidine kinase
MAEMMERRSWQLLSLGTLAAIGGLTLVAHLVHLFEEDPVSAIITGVLPPMLFSVGLLGAAWFLRGRNIGGAGHRRLFVWTIVGAVGLVGLGTALLSYQIAHGVALYDGWYIVINWAGTGALIGALIGYYDVRRLAVQNELRREHDRLLDRERQLKRENERLDRFASIVSHDIRNPLNVASGRVELAQETGDVAHLDAVDDAHRRIETIVEEMLTLARQADEIDEDERTQVSLSSIATECWATVQTDAMTLEFEGDGTIVADVDRLRHVFENLYRNAVEHAADATTVRIGWLDGDEGFYVADDGSGIDDELALFEPGVTTEQEGTGLGLAIVEEIVRAHGWTITETGGADGARFEIRFE